MRKMFLIIAVLAVCDISYGTSTCFANCLLPAQNAQMRYFSLEEFRAMQKAQMLYESGMFNSKFKDEDSQRKMFQNFYVAAQMGHGGAIVELGKYYLNSNNNELAFHWFYIGAECNVEAMFYLGGCYRNGCGVSIDYRKAVECLVKAASCGNENARRALLEDRELNKILESMRLDRRLRSPFLFCY